MKQAGMVVILVLCAACAGHYGALRNDSVAILFGLIGAIAAVGCFIED